MNEWRGINALDFLSAGIIPFSAGSASYCDLNFRATAARCNVRLWSRKRASCTDSLPLASAPVLPDLRSRLCSRSLSFFFNLESMPGLDQWRRAELNMNGDSGAIAGDWPCGLIQFRASVSADAMCRSAGTKEGPRCFSRWRFVSCSLPFIFVQIPAVSSSGSYDRSSSESNFPGIDLEYHLPICIQHADTFGRMFWVSATPAGRMSENKLIPALFDMPTRSHLDLEFR